MQNNKNLKLIAVADINNLKLFTAQGLKILGFLDSTIIDSGVDHKKEKHDSLYQKKSAPGSCFEPHTSVKDIKYQESCRNVSEHITDIFRLNKDLKSLIIIADPKMLGYIRQYLNNGIKKKVIKEVHKDLMNHSIEEIERAAFE